MSKIDTNAIKQDINLAEFISADLGIEIKIEGKSYRLSNADHTLIVYKNANDTWVYRAFRIHKKTPVGIQAYGNKTIFDYLDDVKNMNVKNHFIASVGYIKQVDLSKATYQNVIEPVAVQPVLKKCYSEHDYKFVSSILNGFGISNPKFYNADTSIIQKHISMVGNTTEQHLSFPLHDYNDKGRIVEVGNAILDADNHLSVVIEDQKGIWLSHTNDASLFKSITLFHSDVFIFQNAIDALSYYQISEAKGLYIALFDELNPSNTLLNDLIVKSSRNGFNVHACFQKNALGSQLLEGCIKLFQGIHIVDDFEMLDSVNFSTWNDYLIKIHIPKCASDQSDETQNNLVTASENKGMNGDLNTTKESVLTEEPNAIIDDSFYDDLY
jgi:hypothetical protein